MPSSLRIARLALVLLAAWLLAPLASAATYMDQIKNASATGSYPAAAGSSCMDEFDIFGLAGGTGFGQIQTIQAVVSGTLPPAFRVNIYHNNGNGNLENLRTMPNGDVFTRVFNSEEVQIQPYPVPGDNGNFPPGSFLLSFNMQGLELPLDFYYLSVEAEGATGPFFILGSNTVTEGTLNNLVRIQNQGPAGTATVVADNAAYRVIGIPAPPGSDNCSAGATTGLGATSFSNVDATTDGTSVCGGNHDVWFHLIAPTTGLLNATTCPSNFDTVLSIFDGCNGTELGCNDDADPSLCSAISVPVTAGAHYVIRIAGFDDEMGSGTLTLNIDLGNPCLSPPAGSTPENESCGEDLNGGCNSPPGLPVQSVPPNVVVFGSAWADAGSRDTDWYELTLPGAADVHVSLEAEFSGRLYLFDDACPPNLIDTTTCTRCGPQAAVNQTLAAGTFRVFVANDGFAGAPCLLDGLTHYILRIHSTPACLADFNHDGFRNPDDLADFITCFFLQVEHGICPEADFNNDAFINPDDLADFITLFFLSSC